METSFVDAFFEDYLLRGEEAIEDLRKNNPEVYRQIAKEILSPDFDEQAFHARNEIHQVIQCTGQIVP